MSSSEGFASRSEYGMQPSSSTSCCASPRASTSGRSGCDSTSTLLTTAPRTRAPWAANSAAFRTISSIGRPMPPSLTMMTGASSIPATFAFETPTTAPTPAWPVPSKTTTSLSRPIRSSAARIWASRSSVMRPMMKSVVKWRGSVTGDMSSSASGRPKTSLISTASSSARVPSTTR